MLVNKHYFNNKKTKLLTALVTTSVLALFSGSALTEQLIYTPVNPSFGGNPLNGTFMLSKAQAEKRFSMPMDDFPDFDNGIVAQTETNLIFKKDGQYYAYDIKTGKLRLIDFNNLELPGAPEDAGAGAGAAGAPGALMAGGAEGFDSGVTR